MKRNNARGMKGRDLASSLRESIRSGELPAGAPIRSARELAAEYGVAGITANRVLSELAETGHVIRIRGSGTFVASTPPAEKERGLRIGVGLDLMMDGSPEGMAAFGVAQESLFSCLRARSHHGILLSRDDLTPVALSGVDALLLSPGRVSQKNLKFLLDWGRPVIVMTYRREDLPFHQVGHDYRPGFLSLIRHFKGLGHSRFLVAGINCCTSEERYEALVSMALVEGIHKRDLLRLTADSVPGDFGRLAGQQLGRLWRKKKERLPLISLSDFISFGIVDILREGGFDAGGDHLLASYDNLEGRGLLPFGEPILTAITHPLIEASQEAVHLAEIACGGESKMLFHHRVPAQELVIRQSTGG